MMECRLCEWSSFKTSCTYVKQLFSYNRWEEVGKYSSSKARWCPMGWLQSVSSILFLAASLLEIAVKFPPYFFVESHAVALRCIFTTFTSQLTYKQTNLDILPVFYSGLCCARSLGKVYLEQTIRGQSWGVVHSHFLLTGRLEKTPLCGKSVVCEVEIRA